VRLLQEVDTGSSAETVNARLIQSSRAACERGAKERASAGHGFARSRSNCRSVTVQVRGTDCGVKHSLSSHA
jgi:hypothetical protein